MPFTSTACLGSNAQRGFFTVPAMFVGLVLLGVSVAFLGHGLAETRSVSQYESSTLALELAETGLVRSEIEFLSQVDPDGDGLGSVEASWRGGAFGVQSFEVSAEPTGGGTYRLTAIGTHRHAVRRVELGLKVVKPFRFRHAIFAKERLTIDSSVATDSYDSRLGTYASQATRSDALGPYAEATGHVGSNNAIEIRSSVRVRGDAKAGPGFTTTLVGGSCYVAGSRVPMTQPFDIPDPTLAEFQQAYLVNDNARDVSSGTDRVWNNTTKSISVNSNATLRLRGGTYFFSDFLFDGNATLQVDAPCKIYVTRRFVFNSSSRINFAGKAADLQFVAHPFALTPGYTAPPDDITFTSSVNAAFTLYAPGRNVNLNSSLHVYGAIVGKRVTANSSVRVHYDRALGDAGGGGDVTVERLYWRELTSAQR
jgi:hypothetical protein